MTNETEAPEAELSARLRANCVGQPAEIAWPHRILHEAANALDAQAARIAELEAENREMAMQCLASDGQAQMAYEEQERLEAKLAKVSKSGQAVVDRWDSIDWKDQNHTADYINDLRATLADLQKPIATRDDPA